MTARRRLLVASLPLVVLGALLAWALVCALQARTLLLDAAAGLESVAGEGLDEVEDIQDLQARVARAHDQAERARDLMLQPAPALLARVPVLGRTLAAERDTARAAASVLEVADRALPLVNEVALQGGATDVALLARLADELDRGAVQARTAQDVLAGIELGLTPASVGEAVGTARSGLEGLDGRLGSAAAVVRAARGLLGGDAPRTIVVAVMNNAELRGAGGYASSVALVRTDGGEVDVGPLQDTNDVDDEAEDATRVPAPADVQRRFGPYFADTTTWKNVLMSADGPSSASTLCEVVKVSLQAPCDGVVLLDVPTLADLMQLRGPVTLPSGEQVAGDDLVRGLLVDSYDVADNRQSARRDALLLAADAAVDQLFEGGLGGVELLRVVRDAAAGRHLQVWSAVEQEQRALLEVGATGSADPAGDDLGLVVLNQFSVSKLDYWVDREVALSAVVGPDTATVTQEVTLAMDYPDGLSTYVTGTRGGRLLGLLEVAVAQDAQVREVLRDGQPVDHRLDTDTGSQRVVLQADVGNRESVTWTVVYEVPLSDGTYRVRLLPQPLVRDARLRLSVSAAPGYALVEGSVASDEPFADASVVEAVAVPAAVDDAAAG